MTLREMLAVLLEELSAGLEDADLLERRDRIQRPAWLHNHGKRSTRGLASSTGAVVT